MKKIATIIMLVAAILIGGITVEAKTTKKKGKTKTNQTSRSSNIQRDLDLYEEAVLRLNPFFRCI